MEGTLSVETSNRIIAVVPITTTKIIVWFDGGMARECDISSFGVQEAEVNDFQISFGGELVTWPSGVRLPAEDLYQRGQAVDIIQDEKQRILRELSLIRKEAAFSQTRLGDAAGIRQSVISRIEGCEISPQINTLLKLLAPLGKTLAIVDLIDED